MIRQANGKKGIVWIHPGERSEIKNKGCRTLAEAKAISK
jgi:hypothetical protein